MIQKLSRLDDDEIQIVLNAADMVDYGEQSGVPYPYPGQELSSRQSLEMLEAYHKIAELRYLIGFTACNDEVVLRINEIIPEEGALYLSDKREHPPSIHRYTVSESLTPRVSSPDADFIMRIIESSS